MKSDSFENFNRYKKLVNEKLSEFTSSYENAHEETKRLVHYQSVINVSKEIIRINNSEANTLKDQLLEYFDVIKQFDFSCDKLTPLEMKEKKRESGKLFFEYINPIGSYLMTESSLEFKTKLPFGCFLVIGILFDLIIYFFYNKQLYPLTTIVFFIIGALYQKFKKKNYNEYGLFK